MSQLRSVRGFAASRIRRSS